MSLRERLYELTTVEEYNEFMEKFPTSAVFKAGACHKTMQGFGYVEKALDKREGIAMAFVRVIESRPLSNHIAEVTAIKHESPQFILFVDKKPQFEVNNWDITAEAVEAGLEKSLGALEVSSTEAKSSAVSDISAYLQLLENFIEGSLTEMEFEKSWLETFQLDAAPRSTEEFELLNSLYGDVDVALAENFAQQSTGKLGVVATQTHTLKERAEKLLTMLRQLQG